MLTKAKTIACMSAERLSVAIDVCSKMTHAASAPTRASTGGRSKLSDSQVTRASRNGSE